MLRVSLLCVVKRFSAYSRCFLHCPECARPLVVLAALSTMHVNASLPLAKTSTTLPAARRVRVLLP